MIVKDLRLLIEKFNPECTGSIESAVGHCVTMGNYELTLEHVLYQLCDNTSSDVGCILRHFDVDQGRLKKSLTHDIEKMKSGNAGKPAFSPSLITLMEKAWSLSSLYFGSALITSGVLFLAALDDILRSIDDYAMLLRHIDASKLRSEFAAIVAQSSEQSPAAALKGGSVAKGKGSPEVMEQFCTNFTREARNGKIDPITGRDEEIRQVIDILSRRRKNNPILTGEAGVGKTAVVEGLALRIAAGDVPDSVKGVELWGLDMGLLQAGASVKGEFEKRLKNVIDTVKASAGSIILFIDEAHTLIGAGGAAGQNDAANLLKPALARGELRTCAATTWSEYRKYFEKDPALARRFQLVKVEEPGEEQACTMLRGIAASYEKHHGVHISDEGLRSAVSMSRRYIPGRQLPDKAVDILDTASTRVKMSQSTTPAAIDRTVSRRIDAEKKLAALQRDKASGVAVDAEMIEAEKKAIENAVSETASLNEKWDKEKACVTEINDLTKKAADITGPDADKARETRNEKITELAGIQGETPMVFSHVSRSVVAQVIADWTGIPAGSMMTDEAKRLLTLEDRLRERVLGQEDALYEIANSVRASKTGMNNPDAPMGVFLFAGPSGVGKTECALALADILFGGEKFLTVINMSEYQEKHTVSQLKGSPPGYVGYGEGGILTEAVRQKPYSIVVLDEVEKAHLEVMNMFYQVFDKGSMRDGEGREIDFKNTLIIMTSNLGSSKIIDMCSGETEPSHEDIVDTVRPILSKHFQPALLGRMKIIPFRPLSADYLKGVVALKLDKIAWRIYNTHRMQFACSPKFIDEVANRCTAVEAGARLIDTIIGQTLLPQISKQILAQMGEGGAKIEKISVEVDEKGEFQIAFEKAAGV
jgi:type VI secretion system protein VasG